jgi:hypothetical protein
MVCNSNWSGLEQRRCVVISPKLLKGMVGTAGFEPRANHSKISAIRGLEAKQPPKLPPVVRGLVKKIPTGTITPRPTKGRISAMQRYRCTRPQKRVVQTRE